VKVFRHIDLQGMDGGLARMITRFRDGGTLTGDQADDDYLRSEPGAILLGLLYDQRVLAEYAFTGPARLRDRLGHLDMKRISAIELDELRETFATRPAVHRFTNKMAEYTRDVAAAIVDRYDGNPARIWNDGATATEIARRVASLPGFGKGKAMKMKYVLHYFGYRDFSDEESSG
jgi:uncharacterized HhH-GPD family protein